MPWSVAQNALFRAAEHNPAIAKSHGMTQQKAGQMAHEGIKSDAKSKLAAALMGKHG